MAASPTDTARAERLRHLKAQARKWARERNNAICDWAAVGATVDEIAAALDMAPGTIARIVKDGRRDR